jgi:hypothetical protein
MFIVIEVGPDGELIEQVVSNAPEDLKHDYEYFIQEAKKYSPEGHTQLMHRRFLRSALLILFAHAEAVVNNWVYQVLVKRNEEFRFEKIEKRSLDHKMDVLREAIPPGGPKPELTAAREVRNLWVHCKPGSEQLAFAQLSLDVIQRAATDLDTWMTEMEKVLSIERYPNSEQIAEDFAHALGTIAKSTSSDPKRTK